MATMHKKIYSAFDKYRGALPPGLRSFIRSRIPLKGYDRFLWQKQNPFINKSEKYNVPGSPIIAGIIVNKMQFHRHWIGACRDLNISYKLIDIVKPDWMERILNSRCDVFLVWPDISSVEHKEMFDERLKIMVNSLNCSTYPSLLENQLYENKRLQHYWMKANDISHPRTWIFYEPSDANEFLSNTDYPLVFKSNIDASASGVYIVRDESKARSMVKQAFRYGVRLKRRNPYKRQKGSVYFQEYLPDVKEWRMVRIGESFFGHGKERSGDFHSGSGKVNWELPPEGAFDLLKSVTDTGRFESMDVDIFETTNGRLLVNELQTVFGNRHAKEQMKIDGQPGRYRLAESGWVFEKGSFCQNHLCNQRLQYVIDQWPL